MTIADVIRKDRNNLDLVRLILALMVIYGHSFSLSPTNAGDDIFYTFTKIRAGDFAIKSFFVISGLLVGASLMSKRSALTYSFGRFFRIWPGLIAVVIFTTFIIGPWLTTLSVYEYLTHPETYYYASRQILLQTWGQSGLGYFGLPGLFENNAYPGNANAPLWSIGAEVFCYLVLLAVFVATGLSRWITVTIFLAILVDSFLPQKILFSWLPQDNADVSMLPLCFAGGVLAARFADRIKIGTLLGVAGLAWLMRASLPYPLSGYFVFFVLAMWLSATQLFLRLRVRYDISYGVYLWGWPIQQVFAHIFPDASNLIAFLACASLSLVAGLLSCVVIERPGQRFGRWLQAKLVSRWPGENPSPAGMS